MEGDLSRGPTITTTTILDVPERRTPVWFQVQDGAIPPPLLRALDASLPLRGLRRAWTRLRGERGSSRMALLSMGRDSASGHLRLDRRGRAVLRWDNRREARLYRAEGRVGPLLRRMLGVPVHPSPSWTLLRRAVTVHNLGGVPADRPGMPGVVDEWGQVHGHPGLYVVDGATMPASTGVNPSATILASAERVAEHVVRQHTRDPRWRAPEWDDVEPTPVPEDAAASAMAEVHARTSGDGVGFRERMATLRSRRHREAAVDLRLQVSFPGFDDLLRDEDHVLQVAGTASIADTATARPVRGTLSLFPADGAHAMRYDLEFEDDRGAMQWLVGVKSLRGRGPRARWAGLTQLRWAVGPRDSDAPSHDGTAALGPAAVARMLTTVRGTGFTRARRVAVVGRLAAFFARRALTHPGTFGPPSGRT